MFTGIIEAIGRVEDCRGSSAGSRIAIEAAPLIEEVRDGDSIAVDGVCLTVAGVAGGRLHFDVGPESLSRTTLGQLRPGDLVNLERALLASGRLDGHLVLGHVDCVGQIAQAEQRGTAIDLSIEVRGQPLELVVEKGSIAVHGISLTVNRVAVRGFGVSIVPTTRQRTTVARWRAGSRVNIEFDVIGRYLARLAGAARQRPALDEDFLKEHGFA
ncbi:MAG: riboflavin synthase [Deltaproteobacteria bacterium]|nr:riboflavin synthase [Deltaproteobacteria bacterium]